MSRLPHVPESVQPEASQVCPACAGRGYTDAAGCCDLCEGFGRITVVLRDPEPEPEPEPLFVAVQGTEVLDAGPILGDLIARLCTDWVLADENVVIWRAARAVVLLHSTTSAKNAIRWL